MSDCKSDGSLCTYGGSNPPAAPFFPAYVDVNWKEEYKILCNNLQHSGRAELYYYSIPKMLQHRLNLPKNNRLSFVDIPIPVNSIWHKDIRGKWVINLYTLSGNGTTDFKSGSFLAKDNEAWCINVSEEHRVCTPQPRQFVQIELIQDWTWPNVTELWQEWLRQKHINKLTPDRAWIHLTDSTELVSHLTRTVEWHKAPGIWGLLIVPIKGYTTIEYKDKIINIKEPMILQTNILHRWIPTTIDNVFWAYKIKCTTD